jgi:hypothetical protein
MRLIPDHAGVRFGMLRGPSASHPAPFDSVRELCRRTALTKRSAWPYGIKMRGNDPSAVHEIKRGPKMLKLRRSRPFPPG